MTDRQLLKLAAKSCGLKICGGHTDDGSLNVWNESGRGMRVWNPLTDDGDALRLACDLGMQVFPIARTKSGAACSAVGSVTGVRLSEVADMLPTLAATRRAIVRAAAEIGRAME